MADEVIYAGRRGKGDVVVFQRFHIVDTAGFIGCERCSLCNRFIRYMCIRDDCKWEDLDGHSMTFPRCTCANRSDGRNVYFLTDEDYEKYKVYDAMSEARRKAKQMLNNKNN